MDALETFYINQANYVIRALGFHATTSDLRLAVNQQGISFLEFFLSLDRRSSLRQNILKIPYLNFCLSFDPQQHPSSFKFLYCNPLYTLLSCRTNLVNLQTDLCFLLDAPIKISTSDASEQPKKYYFNVVAKDASFFLTIVFFEYVSNMHNVIQLIIAKKDHPVLRNGVRFSCDLNGCAHGERQLIASLLSSNPELKLTIAKCITAINQSYFSVLASPSENELAKIGIVRLSRLHEDLAFEEHGDLPQSLEAIKYSSSAVLNLCFGFFKKLCNARYQKNLADCKYHLEFFDNYLPGFKLLLTAFLNTPLNTSSTVDLLNPIALTIAYDLFHHHHELFFLLLDFVDANRLIAAYLFEQPSRKVPAFFIRFVIDELHDFCQQSFEQLFTKVPSSTELYPTCLDWDLHLGGKDLHWPSSKSPLTVEHLRAFKFDCPSIIQKIPLDGFLQKSIFAALHGESDDGFEHLIKKITILFKRAKPHDFLNLSLSPLLPLLKISVIPNEPSEIFLREHRFEVFVTLKEKSNEINTKRINKYVRFVVGSWFKKCLLEDASTSIDQACLRIYLNHRSLKTMNVLLLVYSEQNFKILRVLLDYIGVEKLTFLQLHDVIEQHPHSPLLFKKAEPNKRVMSLSSSSSSNSSLSSSSSFFSLRSSSSS